MKTNFRSLLASTVQQRNSRRFLLRLLALMLLTAIFRLPVAAAGATYYVDAAATGSATGDSWVNAFTNLQDALHVATSGDEIWVAQGVYYPDVGGEQVDNDANASFTIPAGVKLYGGFPSGGESEGVRDWRGHKTVLSGDIEQDDTTDANHLVADANGISGNNSNHVVFLNGRIDTGAPITGTTVIDGFLITAGYAGSGERQPHGGGMYCLGSEGGECSPALKNVTFRGNFAQEFGGAMFNDGYQGVSSPALVNVTFSGNAAKSGGALYNGGNDAGVSSPTLVNVTFSGNFAEEFGGAMFNFGHSGASRPALVNVTLSGNAAKVAGGAIYSQGDREGDTSPALKNVVLWQNSAPQGASIFNANADLAILNSIIEGGSDSIGSEGASASAYTGNSENDPLFIEAVDPANAPTASGDLRLQSGSPAIDLGDNSAVPLGVATDLGGNLRMVGGLVDSGAHEFAANDNHYLIFNGVDQYAEFTAPVNLPSGAAPRTVEFWLRANPSPGEDQTQALIVELGAQTHDGSAFGLFAQSTISETQLCFGGNNADICNLAIIPDDQWHFVAVTYAEPTLTTYLDGEWQSSREISTTEGLRLNTQIDKGFIGGSPEREGYFNGGVKNISIWHGVRSAFQIRLDMAAYPKINGNEPGLIAHFPLQEGGGSTFVDLKGTSTGELFNGVAWSQPIADNPSLTAEGIWFVIQNKNDVDADLAILARRQALQVESDDRVVMGSIPLTGNYDEFLWRVQPLDEGKYKLINKKAGVGKALDSSQTSLSMAELGNFTGQIWSVSLANQAAMGLNIYTLSNDFVTSANAVAYSQEQVMIAASNPISTEQAWVFQPMAVVLGYHIPSRQLLDQPFTKVLSLNKGNTLYATHSASEWAILNAHNIYNNMMNAFADPTTAPQPTAKKTFYLISRHDFQPCYYAPLTAASPPCTTANDWRGWSGDETFFTEEMMTRDGVTMRGARDRSYREFEQVVHEFGHTLSEQYFGARDQQTDWAKGWGQQVKEWYPWQVQYWFNSAQSQGANQARTSLTAEVADYIATMFSATNTWLPPRKLRDWETQPAYQFYTPGTFITASETYKIFADEGVDYQMQLQEDGNLTISNAAGVFQWGTFNNLKVPMKDVKSIYFTNGNLYFTTTADQATADQWIKERNPGVLETIHLYNEDQSITARLRINPHPEGNDFLQVINVTPGPGKTAPTVLWSSHAHWSYEGEEGPAEWGELDTLYETCANGTSQSPIDLTGATAQDLTNIAFYYQPTTLRLENNGHTIQVNYNAGSYIVVDGDHYELKQFHFHSPSENTVDGNSYPLEIHLVHKKANQLVVVALFMEEGAENAALTPVWDNMTETIGSQVVNMQIDANALLPDTQATYRFSGSLTTPPCTEGVRWFVMTTPLTLSSEQITAFQSIYHNNNRPVQPLNGRDLSLDNTP